VPGYTSWNEYAALLDYLAKDSTDIVVLLYIPNDVSLDNDQIGIGRGEFTHQSSSPLHRFLRSVYSKVYTAALVRSAIKALLAVRHGPPTTADLVRASDTTAMAYSMEAIRRIDELCRRQGIRFSVGIYRDLAYYELPDLVRAYERKIASALGEQGIEWFMVDTHTARLHPSQAKVTWGDVHSSPQATSYHVSDILTHIIAPASRGRAQGTAVPTSGRP
jgi:hypothetical protein